MCGGVGGWVGGFVLFCIVLCSFVLFCFVAGICLLLLVVGINPQLQILLRHSQTQQWQIDRLRPLALQRAEVTSCSRCLRRSFRIQGVGFSVWLLMSHEGNSGNWSQQRRFCQRVPGMSCRKPISQQAGEHQLVENYIPYSELQPMVRITTARAGFRQLESN